MRTLPTLKIFVSSFVQLSLYKSYVCWNLLVCSFCFCSGVARLVFICRFEMNFPFHIKISIELINFHFQKCKRLQFQNVKTGRSFQLLQPSLFEKIRKQVQASNPKLTESLLLTQMRVFPSSGWELMRKMLEGAIH